MDIMQEYDTELKHVVFKKIHNYVEILDIDFDIFKLNDFRINLFFI